MKGEEKEEIFNHELTGNIHFIVPIGKKEYKVLNALSCNYWDIATVTVLENQKLMISIEYNNVLSIYKGEKADLNDGDGGDSEIDPGSNNSSDDSEVD